MSEDEKFDPEKYDPKVGEQGWAALGRESKFTRMVLEYRWNRQRFKESLQRQLFDKSRPSVLTDERIEEYERISLFDRLTGLYNARAFRNKLRYELRRAKRYRRPLSLLILSVDKLEEFERLYGKLCIDDALRATAHIVRQAIRDVDLPARVAMDQIAVLFPETYSSRAVVVAERIRETLYGTPVNEDLRSLRLTASVGVVSFPTHGRDEVDLYNKALEFVEVSRNQGGNYVCNG